MGPQGRSGLTHSQPFIYSARLLYLRKCKEWVGNEKEKEGGEKKKTMQIWLNRGLRPKVRAISNIGPHLPSPKDGIGDGDHNLCILSLGLQEVLKKNTFQVVGTEGQENLAGTKLFFP